MGTRENRLVEAVLTSTHNLCFEQKYEKYQKFLAENFHFCIVKFSVYLNRRVFVICGSFHHIKQEMREILMFKTLKAPYPSKMDILLSKKGLIN